MGRGAAPWHTGVLPVPPVPLWVMGRYLHPLVLEDEKDFSSSTDTEGPMATLHHHPLTIRLQ